jgi:hypothetical protein
MAKKKKLTEIEKRIKLTVLPKVNYKEHNSVSASQFSIWLKCKHEWYLTNVKKLAPFKQTIHMHFGTAIHNTIQNYLKTMYEISTAEADRIDLEAYFDTEYFESYKAFYEKNKFHFITKDELKEFYEDGLAILDWFKKNKNKYFSKRNYVLLGVEFPITFEVKKNVYIKGYIDLILYNEKSDTYEIFDFKTSTRGWQDYDKKSESKTSQLILYKDFFSKIFEIDPDKINVEFMILKRKVPEESDFPIKRIQTFSPSQGKTTMNKVRKHFEEFLTEAFDDEGEKLDKVYEKNPGEFNCKFCAFNNTEHCNKKN